MKFSRLSFLLPLALFVVHGCSPEEKILPTLSVSAAQDAFVNGTAYLSFNLSSAAETDVVVSLAASANFDTGLLSFRNPLTIPAGSLTQAMLVTIDDSALQPGVDYNATISVEGAAGAKVGKSSSVSLRHSVRKAVAEISLTGPGRFTDGKATLTLTPDVPPVRDITVTLEILKSGASEGMELISPGAVTCPETVVLPADQAAPTTFVVRVDLSQLKPVESEAIIAIESVSSGGVAGESDEVHILAKGDLQAVLRTDWSISYAGDEPNPAHGGVTESQMLVSGVMLSGAEGFHIRYGDAGYVSRDFNSFKDYLLYVEEDIAESIADNKPYTVRANDGGYFYARFPVCSYDFYVLGCDAKGHLTGDYAKCTVQRLPTEKMKETYPKWTGTWEVNGSRWQVSAKEGNASYTIKGLSGTDYAFTANLGWDGELEIPGRQYVDVSETEWYALYGIYGSYYSSYTGVAARAVLDDSGTFAQWEGGINPNTGDPFEAIEMYAGASNSWTGVMALPEFMCLDHEGQLPEDVHLQARYAPYEAFLGNWVYQGTPFRITQKVYGESYYADQTDDPEAMPIELSYSPATGGMTLAEQEIPVDDSYSFAVSGAVYNQTQEKLMPHFPLYTITPGTPICKFFMNNDGTVSWLGQDAGDYFIHQIGVSYFRYGDASHSSISGWMWAGDVFIETNSTPMQRAAAD